MIAVLTEGDEAERKAEECHFKSHGKLAETIKKFFTKLDSEETKWVTILLNKYGHVYYIVDFYIT